MILEKQTEANILTTGGSQGSIGMSLDLDSAQVLMQMLSKNLYSDSIGSTIRECASNALDSHRRAGIDKPIIVAFSRNNANNYEFSVEDFGIGLDAEDVENIISKYGKSTKRNSNIELGMMGLGFKAPLAYCSTFYFVCRKNGVERKYMMYEGEDTNTIDLLSQINTDEPNGVKIIIPVKWQDRHDFIKKSKEQLAYFDSVYFNFEDEDIKNDFVIFRGEDYQFSELATDGKLHICLDNVYYPIDFEKLGISTIQFPLALRFSLSDRIFPTPNREALRYTQEAKQIILDKITKVADYFVSKYNESIDEGSDIYSLISYFSSSDRYVKSFNNNYNLNVLVPFTTKTVKSPSIKGKDGSPCKLDLSLAFVAKEYWLSEYLPKILIKYKQASNLEKRGSNDWRLNKMQNNKVYFYSDKLSGVKKDYIKSIANSTNGEATFIVRKSGKFKLGFHKNYGDYNFNYYNILELKNYPRTEWRELIKEFQYIVSLITKDFIDLDKLVVPQTFIDSRKRIKLASSPQGTGRRVKLSGQVFGKEAVNLMRFVDGKNCKWVPKTYDVEHLYKNNHLTIYGSEKDVDLMNDLYVMLNKVNFVIFSDRELENVKKFTFHNWMSVDKFMKGDNKIFKRTVTATLIYSLFTSNRSMFDRLSVIMKLSDSLADKLNELYSYKNKFNRNSTDTNKIMLETAIANNYFDTTIYDTYLEVKNITEKLPFLNVLCQKMTWSESSNYELINCVKNLCKYHKFRLDFTNYNYNIVEESTEN